MARRLPRAARPRSRGPAPLRPTCHQAQRLARRSSRPEHASHSGGPAPGMAGGRGDERARAQRSKQGTTQWSAAPCASSGPVRQAGKAALVNTAGAAGHAVSREGWKPARVETRSGSMRTARVVHRQGGWARGPARPGQPDRVRQVHRVFPEASLITVAHAMRATVIYGTRDVRVVNVPDATLVEPTDAIVRVTQTCTGGSDRLALPLDG